MKHPCTKCEHPAVIFQPYSGMYLCERHLIGDVKRKAKRDLRKYNIKRGRIAVALSGGKDTRKQFVVGIKEICDLTAEDVRINTVYTS